MKSVAYLFLLFGIGVSSPCQTYTLQTLAGGGRLTSAISNWDVADAAVDALGNVFMTLDAHNVVLRLDPFGGLSLVAGNGTKGYSGDGGPAARASFNGTAGIAVGPDGSLYVADTYNNRVRRISNGIVTTVAGNGTQGFSGDGGPATDAALFYPAFVALDPAGNLYISDPGNSRVRMVSNGVISTVAGNGKPGYSGDSGFARNAQLFIPFGLAIDPNGSLYIADSGNNVVRQVTNGIITTLAGNASTAYNGDNQPATSASLKQPLGLAVDAAGNLYIADSGHDRIREVSGGIITTVVGSGTGSVPANGDNGSATSAELSGPSSVAFDGAGNLYLSDENHKLVREVSHGIITTIAGAGANKAGGDGGDPLNATLAQPFGIAVDFAGAIYFADSGNNRVRKIANGVITTVAGGGTGFSENAPASSVALNVPSGIALDPSGNLYIGTRGRVFKVSNGRISSVAGGGASYGENVAATSAMLLGGDAIAVDPAGNLYIADSGAYRIRKVTNGIITTIVGNGTWGRGVDNVPATSTPILVPHALAVDQAGNLFFTEEQASRIRKVSNGIITTVASGLAGDLAGVAADAAGNIYVTDAAYNLVRVVSGNSLATIAGNGGASWGGDDGLATNGQLYQPRGLAVDSTGNLYVSDELNNRIRVLIPRGAPPPGMPAITPSGIFNTASGLVGAIVAGSIATLYGSFPVDGPAVPSGETLPTTLSGLSIHFGNPSSPADAGLFYVSPGQVNLQVPWEAFGQALVWATYNGQNSPVETAPLQIWAPGIFALNGQGTGQGAILDMSYRVVDASNPAAAGDVVQIFCTGLGSVVSKPPSGSPAPDAPDRTVSPFAVNIGGQSTNVLYSGLAPGTVGTYQINVQVPPGVAKRPDVPVTILPSNTVTMAVE